MIGTKQKIYVRIKEIIFQADSNRLRSVKIFNDMEGKNMNHKKLIAGVLAVTLIGGGAIMPGETIKTLSDSMVMNVSAVDYIVNTDSFEFNYSTGVMTLKGNVAVNDVKNFELKNNVKVINAKAGTVFPLYSSSMFKGYTKTVIMDLKNVDTSSVDLMDGMFRDCSSLSSLDLSSFDTSSVSSMSFMFQDCSSLSLLDLSSFDTSSVYVMNDMFHNCSSLSSLDLSSFDTSSVISMSGMFQDCSSLSSLDLSSFDTSSVNFMGGMFQGCSSLSSLDLSSFDTSRTCRMENMFKGCSSLSSLDLSSFDTSRVFWMYDMFSDCSSLTSLDLSNFDTSNVEYMHYVFRGCTALKSIDLSGFTLRNDTSVTDAFNGCLNLKTIRCPKLTYNKFITEGDMANTVELKVSGLKSADIINLTQSYNPAKIVFSTKAPDSYSTGNIPIGDTGYEAYYDKFTETLTFCGYKGGKLIAEGDYSGCFKRLSSLKSIDFSGLDTSYITNMAEMFSGCQHLESINLSRCDLSNVTDMSSMFYACTSLKSVDFHGYNLSNVTDMSKMFFACTGLKNINLKDCNASNVTNMEAMFYTCISLENIDFSGFDTSNVTKMNKMFLKCLSLENVNMSTLNTSNVEDFESMFYQSGVKNANLSGLVTNSATNLKEMFREAKNLETLNMTNWNTSKVGNFTQTFYSCNSLKKVDLTYFEISNAAGAYQMFSHTPVEEIVCTQGEYNSLLKYGLSPDAVRVDKLCTLDVRFQSTSMTLGGSISLNFYSELKGVSAENLSKTYAEFEVNGKKQTVKFNPNNMNAAKTRYGFTCMLNSVSMADDIKATLYYYDENGVKHSSTVTSNVQAYLKKSVGNTNNSAKMISLAKAINDYGYYMQKFLSVQNGWTIGTEHKGMETVYTAAATYQNNKSAYLSALEGHKVTKSVVSKDISGATISLTLDSDTALNFKVTPTADYAGKVTITIDGKAATATKLSDGKYQITIPNISADQLGDIHTIAIKTTNGTSTYKLSALTYSYNSINSSSTSVEKYNAACALYEYYKAAMAYKG